MFVTKTNLIDDVCKYWSSLFTLCAIFYRYKKKPHETKVSVGVNNKKRSIIKPRVCPEVFNLPNLLFAFLFQYLSNFLFNIINMYNTLLQKMLGSQINKFLLIIIFAQRSQYNDWN